MRSNRIDEALYGRKYGSLKSGESLSIVKVSMPCNTVNPYTPCNSVPEFKVVNPNNLFDHVGFIHNQALDYYFKHKSFSKGQINAGTVLSGINDFLSSQFGFRLVGEEATSKLDSILKRVIFNGDPLIYEGKAAVSSEVVKLVEDVLDRLSRLKESEIINEIEYFKMIEDKVAAMKLTQNEMALMLSSMAVGRYALSYKLTSVNGPSIPWNPDEVARKFPPFWVGADLSGAWSAYQLSMAGIGGTLGGPVGFFGTMAAVGAGTSYISTL